MAMLRLWRTTKAEKSVTPLHGQLPSDKPLTIEHLSTSQLRDLASITEEKSVAHGDRALLLDIVQEKLSSDLGKQWLVEHGKVHGGDAVFRHQAVLAFNKLPFSCSLAALNL